MNRSPLTEQYQRVMSLVEQLHELPEDERNFILDLLVPLPEQSEVKKATKRASKKSGKSASKSARASGMAATIKDKLQQREPTVGGFADDADMVLCRYRYPKDSPVNSGIPCNQERVNGVHDKSMGYAGYHEFQPAGKPSAQPVRGRSSTNGGAGSDTASSEMAKEDVSNVHVGELK